MSRKVLLSLAVVLAVGLIGFYTMQGNNVAGQGAEQAAATAPAAGAAEAPVTAPVAEQAGEASETTPAGGLDVEKALAQRTVGNPDAPVVIEEFASLSCSHCASFYNDTYPQLKAEYIDTGKVYFIYTDFPLNAPALDAAMVARCLPDAHYFNFIKMLFENQAQWAFGGKHREILQHNAAMLGMSTDGFNGCLDNAVLREGLITRMQEKSEKHQVRSTPSFIVDNNRVIAGAVPYAQFKEVIDGVLLQKKAAQ